MDLVVRRFAQLDEVSVPLRDLVVLVGPQATGKSLVLQILKLVLDRTRIVRTLKDHGFTWDHPRDFASIYFGGGFEPAWTAKTEVALGNRTFSLEDVSRSRGHEGEEAVFFVPAHRTLAIAEGWPKPFVQYPPDTPYVVRRFSEQLLTLLNQGLHGKAGTLFPHDRRFKAPFRRSIDKAIFHGASLKLQALQMRKQFVLEYDTTSLPFMAWTAGQREFTPLLLGLYHLLPAGGAPKKKGIDWAIIEEPEMGLHPLAIVAVMAVVLDLLHRGYRVALSTHSPAVLDVVWGLSRLQGVPGAAGHVCDMLDLPRSHDVLATAESALDKTYSVVHLLQSEGRFISADISDLDPGSSDVREAQWGGLTGFSARVAEVVATARAAAE